jgi:hypothetical protein
VRQLFFSLVAVACLTGSAHCQVRFEGSLPFQAQGAQCLADIRRLGGPGAQLLSQIRAIPITVTRASGANSATAPYGAGRPQSIEWSLNEGVYECDGTPKLRCAALLHELQHAFDQFTNQAPVQPPEPPPPASEWVRLTEWRPIRIENWILSRLRVCQRVCYTFEEDSLALPYGAHLWWQWPPGAQNIGMPPEQVRKIDKGRASCEPTSPQSPPRPSTSGHWIGIVEHCPGTPGTGTAPGVEIGGPGGIIGPVCIFCQWTGWTGSERKSKWIVAPDDVLKAYQQPRAYERDIAVERACGQD